MLKYYFCDICLEVSSISFSSVQANYAVFTREQPYSSVVRLNFIESPSIPFNPTSIVAAESNVEIGLWNNGWIFSTLDRENFCSLKANSDYSELDCFIDRHSKEPKRTEENLMQLLRLALECNLAYYGKLSLHSSCIMYDNRSVLFTAPSGTGKSTQAELWKSHLGADILNGDRPCLCTAGAEVHAHGVPWDGKEQIFRQDSSPVEAILEVRQAKKNTLRKLSEMQAFRLLLKQTFIPVWDDAAKFLILKTMKTVVKTVPFYRLFCLPDSAAVRLVERAIISSNNMLIEEGQCDMQIKDGFLLRNVVGEWIVMPKGSNIQNFEGAIVLNDVAAFLWRKLESPISKEDLLTAVLDEYDVDVETASRDLTDLIEKLSSLNILEQGIA